MVNKDLSTKNMKDNLINLCHWFVKWKMVFNPDPNKPAEEVVFTNRNISSYETVSYLGVDVQPIESHKHLGFVLDSKLSYMNHIDGKIEK